MKRTLKLQSLEIEDKAMTWRLETKLQQSCEEIFEIVILEIEDKAMTKL